MKTRKLRTATFTVGEDQLIEYRRLAEALGFNVSETVRRALNVARPILKKAARHAVGVERAKRVE